MKRHKGIKIALIVLVVALVTALIGGWSMFGTQLTAANTIEKLDEGLWSMEYKGETTALTDFSPKAARPATRPWPTTALHHVSCSHHHPVNCLEKQLIQTVLFQQMPEVQQRRGIRHVLLQEVDPHELSESVTVVNGIFHALVGQVEPTLQQVHPQHDFYALRRAAALTLVVKGQNDPDPLVPGDDLVHDFQKLIPLCLLFPIAVFVVA